MRALPKYIILLLALALACCTRHSSAWGELDRADSLIESAPDSSLAIILAIDPNELLGTEERARYALLLSMALDKNHIDTTTLDILQPAIDYYADHGTPDDKLRSCYYQGRIYQNRGEDGTAVSLMHDAISFADNASDKATLARAHVCHGSLMYTLLRMDESVHDNLCAYILYVGLDNETRAINAIKRAANGALSIRNQPLSDSIFDIINEKYGNQANQLFAYEMLHYATAFNDSTRIKKSMLDFLSTNRDLSEDDILLLTQGYLQLNDIENAHKSMLQLDYIPYEQRSMRHVLISSDLNRKMGRYKESLGDFMRYNSMEDSLQMHTITSELQYAEYRRIGEINTGTAYGHLRTTILLWIFSILGLLAATCVMYLYVRINKMKRIEAEQANCLTMAKLEKEKAEHAELVAKIGIIEREYEDLRELLDSNTQPTPINRIIQTRAELINDLLVGYATERPKVETRFLRQAKELVSDRNKFLDDTQSAVKALYPRFIKNLEDNGLSTDEINYICLYAIGMTGKEIGIYMERPGHYNIASAIRKKLGLDSRSTNLGIYVRQLLGQE